MNNQIKHNVETTQKVGCVLLVSTLDEYPLNMNYEYLRLQLQLIQSTPIRLVAIYVLALSPNGGESGGAAPAAASAANGGWNNAIEFATYIMGKTLRLRTRCIRGTPMECRYQLLCLGFTPHNLPKELMDQANAQQVMDQSKKRKALADGEQQQQREHGGGAAGVARQPQPIQVSTVILDDE